MHMNDNPGNNSSSSDDQALDIRSQVDIHDHEHAIIITDDLGKIVGCNDTAVQIYGYSQAELTGKKMKDLYSLSYEGKPKAIQDQIIDPPGKGIIRMMHQHKDGSSFYVEQSSQVIILMGAKYHRYTIKEFNSTKDSSLNNTAQSGEDIQSSQTFQSVMEDVPFITYIQRLNLQLSPVYLSPQIRKLTGYTPEDYKMEPELWKSLVHPEDRDKLVQDITEAMNDGKPLVVEYRIIARDGSILWVNDQARIVNDRNNQPQFLQGVRYDITEQRRTENLLEIQRDLGLAMSSTNDLKRAFEYVLDAALKIDEVDCGGIYLYNELKNSFVLYAVKGLGDNFVRNTREILLESPSYKVFTMLTPVYLPINILYDNPPQHVLDEGIRTVCIIPIISEGRTIATLTLASHANDSISRRTRSALESIASQISGAILRIRALSSIQNSWRNLQGLFDSLDEFLLVMNLDLQMIHFNQAFEKKMGYHTHDLLEMKLNEFHPKEEGHDILRIQSEVKSGKNVCYTIPFISKSGDKIAAKTALILGTWNEQSVIIGISQNMTRQIESEASIQSSEFKYTSLWKMVQAAVDNIPEMVWAKDLEGRYIIVNNSTAQRLLNAADTDEPIGKNDLFFSMREKKSHPENSNWHTLSDVSINSDKMVVHNGQVKRFDEFGYVNGIPIHLDVHKSPIWDANGTVIGTVGFAREVLSETVSNISGEITLPIENLKLLLHNLPVLVQAVDQNGMFVFWNSECERETGYSAAEVIGNSKAKDLLFPDSEYYQKLVNLWNHHHGEYRNLEWNIVCKDGSVKTINWSNLSKYHPIPGWYSWAIGINVTDQVNVQFKLKKLEEHLQDIQKFENLGMMVGGIAQGFNNLLTGILGNAQMALSELSLHSNVREYVRNIETAARRSADLTEQLRTYSSKQPAIPKSLSLNEIITEMVNLLKLSISKRVTVELDLQPNLPLVIGDATQIRQLLINLIMNASESVGYRSGTIKVKTCFRDYERSYLSQCVNGDLISPGSFVVMEVIDTGMGIALDNLTQIFNPYFSTKMRGRGLGLATVLGIIKAHQGAIHVESSLGKGATFSVLLPVKDSGLDSSSLVSEEISSQDNWKGSGTVLFIEDDSAVRKLGRMMLEKTGFRVIECANREDGVSFYKFKSHLINLILMDIGLPGMGGEEIFHEIKKINMDAHIILTSGFTNMELIQKLTQQKYVGYLQKPFNFDRIKFEFKRI